MLLSDCTSSGLLAFLAQLIAATSRSSPDVSIFPIFACQWFQWPHWHPLAVPWRHEALPTLGPCSPFSELAEPPCMRRTALLHQLIAITVWLLGSTWTWTTLSKRIVCPACPQPRSSAWPLRFCTNSSCLRPVHHASMPLHFACQVSASTPSGILVCSHHQRFRSL